MSLERELRDQVNAEAVFRSEIWVQADLLVLVNNGLAETNTGHIRLFIVIRAVLPHQAR